MKKFGLLLIFVGLLTGYIAGNFFPFSRFNFIPGKSIAGNAKLEVKLVNETGTPLSKIEVDIGEKSGPPPEGGHVLTDENGIATFNIQPGNYFIFFNTLNFPKNFVNPTSESEHQTIQVQVEENKLNEKKIILKAK